jgi:hypothetical protein
LRFETANAVKEIQIAVVVDVDTLSAIVREECNRCAEFTCIVHKQYRFASIAGGSRHQEIDVAVSIDVMRLGS